jgi:hypothetical protein
MVKIILEIADNGVVKTVQDDNSNGAGSFLEKKVVYDFENDPKYLRRIKFFFDISDDLGIEIGNNFERNTLSMKVEWGSNYTPKIKEIDNKMKEVELELSALNLLKQELLEELNQEKEEDERS